MCGNVFVAGEFNYKSFLSFPYAYATFPPRPKSSSESWAVGGGGGGEGGAEEGGGVKILFLMNYSRFL